MCAFEQNFKRIFNFVPLVFIVNDLLTYKVMLLNVAQSSTTNIFIQCIYLRQTGQMLAIFHVSTSTVIPRNRACTFSTKR